MTFIEAAAEVLRQAGKPLHYKEITELAIAKNLLSHVGKTPEVTMSHRLTAAIKKDDTGVPVVRVRPGVFALREWQTGEGKKSLRETDGSAGETEDDAGGGVNALEIEAALRPAEPSIDDEEMDDEETQESQVSGEDALRADLAASGAELFDDEDDDDQPILAPFAQPEAASPQGDAVRRRRRRRRRGRGNSGQGDASTGPYAATGPTDRTSAPRVDAAGMSIATPSEAEPGAEAREPGAPPRPVVRDRQQIMAGGQPTGVETATALTDGEELAGRELADAAVIALNSFDRNAGPAPIRAIVDLLLRRGRLQGDPILAVAQLSASIRADNLRRSANGQRPRFRFATGGRIALTDWSLSGELPRLEQEVVSAIDRYRDACRRGMLRKLQELPGHALIEIVLVALERSGMTGIKPIRRSGSPGGESHFSAVHKTGGDAVPVAIVVRKDGREIGRERVTDLRGALHHYGPAAAGWLLTTGQVLSGAREEASAPGAPPLALYDGIALCKLLEETDVGVIKTRFAIAISDLELFETLRG
jgi:HB1/ASXL restriction endonuclease-like protein with HTH domain/restriction endonuclease